jgi:hypothetical protein
LQHDVGIVDPYVLKFAEVDISSIMLEMSTINVDPPALLEDSTRPFLAPKT